MDRKQLNKNIEKNLQYIEAVVESKGNLGFPLKLIVFPELTINGLPYNDPQDYIKRDLALTIPGKETAKFEELATKYNIYICVGSWVEKDPDYPSHLFNTSCVIGPEGLLLKYRKINTWECAECVLTSPHSIDCYNFEKDPAFPVVKTPIGTLGVAICYDYIFPEVTRELAMQGAEVFIRPSAYMDPYGTEFPMNWFTTVSQVRSLENVAYGVHVNEGGTAKKWGGQSFPGGSCIVDYEGRVLSQVNRDGEQTLLGPIDIDGLREWRANTYEHAMPAQIRSEVYTSYLNKSWLPQGDLKKDEANSIEKSKKRIDEGRKRVWGDILEQYKRK
jgi:predicted amidohydrolase